MERTQFGKTINSHKSIGVIYTLMVVLIGWVFFRSDTLAHAINYLRAMIGLGEGVHSASMLLDLKTVLAILLGVVGSTPITEKIKVHLYRVEASGTLFGRAVTRSSSVLSLAYVYSVFALSLIFISMSTYNPFIYFQF
jgi:alginate O-acetyltransferase complex protein AlgI